MNSDTLPAIVAKLERGATLEATFSNHHLWDLWEILATAFGQRFIAEHGASPPLGWLYLTRSLTVAQMAYALDNLAKQDNARFVPSAVDFVRIAESAPLSAAEGRRQYLARHPLMIDASTLLISHHKAEYWPPEKESTDE